MTLTREQESDLQRLRTELRYDSFTRLASLAIGRGAKWGCFAYLGHQAAQTVQQLAGKTTLASILLSLGVNVDVVTKLSWTVSVGLLIWVILERRLRKRRTEQLAARVAAFERGLDPGRSSSLLTPKGETRPEDQL